MSVSPRILYVDDDADGREMVAYWLSKAYGYEVVSAMDGAQAKKFIYQQFFDLYLLDYCLSDTTATSLCRDIKSSNPTAPIIVYSALDREIDRDHAIEAGANFYFVKPDQMEMVGSAIVRIFGDRGHLPGRSKHFRDHVPPPSIAPHLNKRIKAAGIL